VIRYNLPVFKEIIDAILEEFNNEWFIWFTKWMGVERIKWCF
jgi:hypothetical protein